MSLGGEHVQWTGRARERRGLAAEAEHLRVRAEREEAAGKKRALQHCAGNGAQGIAYLAAQRGCTLEADKTEDGEHQSRPKRAERNSLELELAGIELKADVHWQEDEHDHDQAD